MDKSEYVLNGYTYELIKKVIKDECTKEDGFLRNFIRFQFDVLTEIKELSVRCKSCNREVFESDIRMGKNDINEKGYCLNCTE